MSAADARVDVLDEDVLFRGLPPGTAHYEWAGRRLEVKQSAFNDREYKPSVDLQRLSPGLVPREELHPHAGILRLVAGPVRSKPVTSLDAKGQPSGEHAVDVIHRPVADNQAHAQVESSPALSTSGQFRKLKIQLARLATWEIEPEGESA